VIEPQPVGWRHRVVRLIDDYLEGRLPLERFCGDYEYLWNFERPNQLGAGEAALFQRLFDTVAWYTPFRGERQGNPAFKDEGQVIEAVLSIREALGEAWKSRERS